MNTIEDVTDVRAEAWRLINRVASEAFDRSLMQDLIALSQSATRKEVPVSSCPPAVGQATGHDFYNAAHANKQAVAIALDALRKIRLGHPCDVPELIAAYAIEEIEGLTGPPKRRDLTAEDHVSPTITKG